VTVASDTESLDNVYKVLVDVLRKHGSPDDRTEEEIDFGEESEEDSKEDGTSEESSDKADKDEQEVIEEEEKKLVNEEKGKVPPWVKAMQERRKKNG
jgi:hypothetical protein